MSRHLVGLSLLLAAAAAVVALGNAAESRALRQEVEALRDRPSPAVEVRLREVEERVDRLADGIGSARDAVPSRSREEGAPAGAGGGRAAGGSEGGAGGAAAGAGPEGEAAAERLREFVRRTVARELDDRAARAAAGGGDEAGVAGAAGKGKPSLGQVAALLEMSGAQRDSMKEAVIRGQTDVIAALRTPMADGRIPLDVLTSALLDEPEKRATRVTEVFGILMTEKVPGGEATYAERVEGIKKGTVESFRRDLTPEQFREYEKMGQDPLEIQVEGSPWVEVLQEAFRRRR